ncbi:MAG: lysylphosphatidylglycerol synthase transmembrane domain-containing protein [Rhodobacterales bacterium]
MGYLLRLGVSLAVLAALVWIIDAPAAYDRLRSMDLRWIAVAVVCFSLVTLLMARRWQITARRLGASFGFGWAVREYYLSQMVNLCLPGGVLGDAGRAVRTPRGTGGLTHAAHAVMIERLIGQGGVLLVGLFGVALALLPGGVDWPGWLLQALGWGALALCLGGVVLALVARRAGPVQRFGQSLGIAVLDRRVMLPQIALSLAIVLLLIAGFAACAQATGTLLSIEAALTLVPLILTAMMIPLSVGGWGLREGAAAALFPIIGAAPSAGVAAGAAYGLALMIACLPGLLLIPLSAKTAKARAQSVPPLT